MEVTYMVALADNKDTRLIPLNTDAISPGANKAFRDTAFQIVARNPDNLCFALQTLPMTGGTPSPELVRDIRRIAEDDGCLSLSATFDSTALQEVRRQALKALNSLGC